MRSRSNKKINIWVILGALAVFLFLVVFWVVVFLLFTPEKVNTANPTAILMVIPAPTMTVPPSPTAAVTQPSEGETGGGEIKKGGYVQVTGTGDAGLRLRSDPGINSSIIFLAKDNETYLVQDGPIEADGYTWWLLSSTDSSKSGWGVSTFLTVIGSALP